MTPEQTDLARRLAVHSNWDWNTLDSVRIGIWYTTPEGDHIPDLTDPATQGCLWHLLCESLPHGWAVLTGRNGLVETYDDQRGRHDHSSVASALLWLWSTSPP